MINVSRTALAVSAAVVLVLTGGAASVADSEGVLGSDSVASAAVVPNASPSADTASGAASSKAPGVATAPGSGAAAGSRPAAGSGAAPGSGPAVGSGAAAGAGPASGAAASTASPAIGALFSGGHHFCSASVVHSPAGDLVLTAAHCLGGGTSGLTFEPGYHDGIAPFGSWTVTSAAVPPGWTADADQDLDFAFLTVTRPGTAASLESLTGANQLGLDRGFTNVVTMTGYPDTTDAPVVCTGTTTRSDTYQQRLACPGFPDGTSGGPWLTTPDPTTGLGTVVGVIGGYEQGGDTPDVSYSAYFDDDIRQLYDSVTG
ncbi:trypsin-like serine protease [Amycolatopsis rhabdoformis]|uniref:Trypsin-like serine protease n=1 Tax=Amycolatopsis rhabdoformis TaxID=1448059 RepID=A0ABZ1II72_9PSEU|nr:trypsin-like serine protease [Amycolatopsis rhabdoformis]WSE33816.1 trypsin-like serine protease [Amycolatopsis rhabdoformis]